MDQNRQHQLIQELATLKQDHRELDLAILVLEETLMNNQLEVKRLKKQKLKLKDTIARLESDLIPDLHA